MSELLEGSQLQDGETFEVELVEEEQSPISLESRLSYVDDHLLDGQRRSVGQIISLIHGEEQWVYRKIKKFSIEQDGTANIKGVTTPVYPDFTAAVLQDELTWLRSVRQLPTPISERKMADMLGMPLDWVQTTLDELEVKPAKRAKDKQRTPLYGKSNLHRLRDIRMEVPLDNDWHSLAELKESTGMSKRWINSQLAEIELYPMSRRSAQTGKVFEYYPPGSVDVLLAKIPERILPAGDWMTAQMIAEYLGRSLPWVKSRLVVYENESEIRLDDNEKPKVHYSPTAYRMLEDESQMLLMLPDTGSDTITTTAIAEWLGEDIILVQKRLADLGIQPELRRNKLGQMVEVYSHSVIQRIKADERKVITFTLDAQNVVGSLRSQIRIREASIVGLDLYGAGKENEQRVEMVRELAGLRKELKKAVSILFTLEDTVGSIEPRE